MPEKGFRFFKELKRRKVYRVATVYAITGWIIMQVAAVTFPHLNLPGWLISTVIVLVLIGFPVALVLAWAFEVSPDGIVRTSSVEAEKNPLPDHKRKPLTGTITIVFLLILLVGQSAYFRFVKQSGPKKGEFVAEASIFPSNSIAVLPFKNMSKEKDNQYFSDGVMEAILNNLSRINDLKVVSRTSVEPYRNNPDKQIPEIAAELEVANVLEGSVQRMGNNVRIVVQLISAAKDEHIWATNYDRDISDIFVVQSEIAKTIADNLEIILTSNERELIENAPTTNLKAYDLYLKAVHQKKVQDITGRNKSDVDSLIEMFAQVIRMDENFGLAYGMLGEQLSKLNRWGVPKSIWVDSAMHMLDKALQLDPTNANVYRYKANIYHLLHLEDKVKENLLKGLQYDPNNFLLLKHLGIYFERLGNQDRAMDYFLKSWAVNKPVEDEDFYNQFGKIFIDYDWKLIKKYYENGLISFPESSLFPDWLSYIAISEQKYKEALQYALKVEEIDLKRNYNGVIGYCYLLNKQYLKSEEYFNKNMEIENKKNQEHEDNSWNWEAPYYAYVKIKSGKIAEGKKMINAYYKKKIPQTENYTIKSVVDPDLCILLAKKYALDNKNDEAIAWLEKAVKDGKANYKFWWRFQLMSDPYFDILREEDRYKKVLVSLQEVEENRRQLFREKLDEYHARDELKWFNLE